VNAALSIDIDYMQQKFSTSAPAALTAASPSGTGNYLLGAISYDFGIIKPSFVWLRHRGGRNAASMIPATSANPHNDLYELRART
jgi:hypothetical protein